jgi:hypothetical protein
MSDLSMHAALARPSAAARRPARSRRAPSTGLGLVIAATLSSLMWLIGLLAVHALLA